MKVKKYVALALVSGVAISATLSGLDEISSRAMSNVTEITYWAMSTQQDNYEPVVEAFNKENKDIKVNISYHDTDGIKDACKVAASSKTLPNMWFNWGGSLGGFYVENGLTYNLNDLAKEYNWSDKFNENALELCTYDGVISGYPSSYNILGVFYRKDLFEKYAIEVPETLEEFEAACETLKENGITVEQIIADIKEIIDIK